METRLHELEHESKMRLLNPRSHTSERRDYETGKERQEKGKKEGLSVRDRENVKETHRYITWKGGRGENVSTEKHVVDINLIVRLLGVRHRHPFCQVRLLSRFSLLLTCAGCVEIEDNSF